MIVIPLDALVDGVYVRAHLLFESKHKFGLKIPPAPLSLHDMIPIMEEDGFEVSVTDVVTIIELPGVKVVEFDVTVVVVASVPFVNVGDVDDVDICDIAELPE